MASSTLTLLLLIVSAVASVAQAVAEENEVDYGFWNYREGGDSTV